MEKDSNRPLKYAWHKIFFFFINKQTKPAHKICWYKKIKNKWYETVFISFLFIIYLYTNNNIYVNYRLWAS